MLLLHDNGLHCLVERYRTYSSWCFELSLKSKTAHSLFYPPPWFFCLGFSVNVWLLELHAGGDPPKLEYALHAISHCLGVIHNSLCLTYASIIKSKSLETLVHSERQTFAACFACTSFRRGPGNAALWPLLEKIMIAWWNELSKQRW